MSFALLQDYINAFEREVIDSGFKRDLDDYIASLPASENNIVALRDIASKVLSGLQQLYSGDLPNDLAALLPSEQTPPFTAHTHDEDLRALIDDNEIPQAEFFTKLTPFLNQLNKQINRNVSEIEKIQGFIQPYISEDGERIATEGLAILAIVFNDLETTTSLTQFPKTLGVWNTRLLLYHQLLKSESPEDIQIVEIQNGSIDFVVNLNVDVAKCLAELFTVGWKVFAAYLLYKQKKESINDSFQGDKELIDHEKKAEDIYLRRIGEVITTAIEAQHAAAKKADNKINNEAVETKVKEISELVGSHIVKGNSLKLLALPSGEEPEEDEDDSPNEKEELRRESANARRLLSESTPEARQKLLKAYGTIKGKAASRKTASKKTASKKTASKKAD